MQEVIDIAVKSIGEYLKVRWNSITFNKHYVSKLSRREKKAALSQF